MNASRRSTPAASSEAAADSFRPSALYLLLALGLAGAGLAFWLLLPGEPAVQDGAVASPGTAMTAGASLPAGSQATVASTLATTQPTTAAPAAPAASAASPASRLPEGDADPTRDLSSYVMRGEKPTVAEAIERLHKAGIRDGIGAFSPPGTRPPMIGLAVPEHFVLPDGYVRHHQATDDGQRIEAILMFAPDRAFVDAKGKPIVVPKNRVVPPEHAPPGLPIRQITLPKPLEPDPAGR